MKVSQAKIDEILLSTDIVELISQYTTLKKSGKNYMGRCPFHQERTASFSVSQEKGVYHCFGCGKSGNVFNFIMDMDNVTFGDALKVLAQKANIHIDFDEGYNKEDKNKINTLYEINKRAAKFYYENLHSSEGSFAYEYLYSREIKDKTIKKFGLGFSLRTSDSLCKILLKDFKPEEILESGLAINIGNMTLKDRFRGRLMIPIFSESDRVIAFGARKIFNDDQIEAKYVNSSESKLFNKSRVLYGLNFTKNSISGTGYAIIVEGYMDVIALYDYGYSNMVASCGTSLTDMHIKKLARYTDECVIIFDPDTAGRNAARRGVDILLSNDMKTSIVELPEGEDPDNYIRKSGKDAFDNKLYTRKTVIQYLMDKAISENRLKDPDSKGKFVREIINLINKVKDPIKKELYLKEVSEQTGIYIHLLKKELRSNNDLRRMGKTREEENYEKTVEPIDIKLKPIEKKLLKLLIDGEEKTKKYILENLEIDFLENAHILKIINYLNKNIKYPDRWNGNNIMSALDDKNINFIISELMIDENNINIKNDLEEAQAIINKFQSINLIKEINELNNKIKTNPSVSDNDLKKLNNLIKRKLELERPANK